MSKCCLAKCTREGQKFLIRGIHSWFRSSWPIGGCVFRPVRAIECAIEYAGLLQGNFAPVCDQVRVVVGAWRECVVIVLIDQERDKPRPIQSAAKRLGGEAA
jgi:hypothetical protein